MSHFEILGGHRPPLQKTAPKSALLQFVNVANTQFGELGAQSVEVHAEFTRLQTLARLLLLCKAFTGQSSDFPGRFPFNDNNAVGIGNDHIAGTNG